MPKTISDFLGDPEAKPILEGWLQRESDKRVAAALKSHDINSPRAGDAAAKLAARLDKIEKAHEASVAASELKFFTFKRAVELGIEYELVADLSFPDVAAADAKLSALAEAVAKKKAADFNREMIEHAYRPGSGNGATASRDYRLEAEERDRRGRR